MIRSTLYYLNVFNTAEAEITATATKIASYDDLTNNQKHKNAHLGGLFQSREAALNLTLLIEPKGENSWKKVTDKIDSILQGDYKEQMYDDTLYDNFIIGETYTSDDIIKTVGSVRRDIGMPTYISSLKRNCEHDFFRIYIVHTVTAEICCDGNDDGAPKMKKVIVGYKPMFRLKPED